MSATPAASPSPQQPAIFTRIRLADRHDVPNIHRLIHQMAEFELLTHLFSATESSLSSTLFPSPPLPPFRSFTVLILELSPSPIPNSSHHDSDLTFPPILQHIPLKSPVTDPDSFTFASPRGEGLVVAGFLLCFPNYSSFMGLPGMYIEDVFVREVWRRLGMGKMMMAAVAREAARMGCGRVEWCVLDWNQNAISFYEGMGAEVLPQWRICRLSGEELGKFAVGGEDLPGRRLNPSKMSSSNSMITKSYRDHNIYCRCNRLCMVFTARRGGNSGRSFYRCSRHQTNEDCNFFQWIDEIQKHDTSELNNAVVIRIDELISGFREETRRNNKRYEALQYQIKIVIALLIVIVVMLLL